MSRPRKSVLVVDDQDDERAIQSAMLAHLGYAVSEAADGATALRLATAHPPDLVLLDVSMPRMDGYEVCRALRAGARTQTVSILLFTATVTPDLQEAAQRAGADGVLRKPLDPLQVAAAIREIIGEA